MVRFLAVFALVSFLLHFLWESAHIGLYTGYEGISGPLPVTLYATLGDVLYGFAAYALMALFKRNVRWYGSLSARDVAVLSLLGLAMAVFVEWKGLSLGRWEYTTHMPLVLGFGLSPLLQMTLLLPLSTVLAARFTALFGSTEGSDENTQGPLGGR